MKELQASGIRLFMPDVLRCRALAQSELGQQDAASTILAEAQALAGEIGTVRALWPILMARGELLDRVGDQQEAAQKAQGT